MTRDFHCELGPVPSHRDQSRSRPVPQRSVPVPSRPTEVSPGPVPSHRDQSRSRPVPWRSVPAPAPSRPTPGRDGMGWENPVPAVSLGLLLTTSYYLSCSL